MQSQRAQTVKHLMHDTMTNSGYPMKYSTDQYCKDTDNWQQREDLCKYHLPTLYQSSTTGMITMNGQTCAAVT